MCHPNHCIHHLLPSDRKAKQNDKNQTFLNTILTTGVSRKLMTSLIWWLLLLFLVPWSAWTVGGKLRIVSIWFYLRSLMPHLSDLCQTTLKCHQSIFVQVVPDDAHPRPFQTIMSLTLDHLASCKYAQTVGASAFGLYPPLVLFVEQLLISLWSNLAISLPKYVCNTSSQMQVVFFHPLYLQSMFLLRRVALEKLLSLEIEA